jgi:hypothetical protein
MLLLVFIILHVEIKCGRCSFAQEEAFLFYFQDQCSYTYVGVYEVLLYSTCVFLDCVTIWLGQRLLVSNEMQTLLLSFHHPLMTERTQELAAATSADTSSSRPSHLRFPFWRAPLSIPTPPQPLVRPGGCCFLFS